MDVIYTDVNRLDAGTLQDFSLDFDTTDSMDYELTLGIKDNILPGGGWWYIPGTEYAGIVDSMEVVTANKELRYKGRNLRGILNSKIIEPPAGQDHKTAAGKLCDIAQDLIADAGLEDLFTVKNINVDVPSYKFSRYITLYEGLTALGYQYNKILSITCQTEKNGNECRLGRIEIAFVDRIDYSGDVEFNKDNINFQITKSLKTVNHMICLGQGELKDRTVAHLYVDGDGDIVEKQYFFGLEEYTAVYENTSAESLEELKKGGADRLGELCNADKLEVMASNMNLKIGDVVGGYEEITGCSIRREIVNIIADINNNGISLDYRIGGDEPGAASLPSEIMEEYVLPIASKEILGGIKTGATLSMDEDDTLQSEQLTEFKTMLKQAATICT